MYLITNRHLKKSQGDLSIFGSKPNEKGANELRLVELTGTKTNVRARVLRDQLTIARVRALKRKFKLSIDENEPWYASLEVAGKLFQKARSEKKHILLYVHGYNNDVGDIIHTARAEYVRLQAKVCKVTVNLLCHSMGNYVLKYATLPTRSQIRQLIFDNVCLVAADTNSLEHKSWVGSIECRGRIYVVVNENDSALQWSRRKPGQEQLARLGQYLKGLNSPNVTYVDVTNSPYVRDEHSYFTGKAVKGNAKLRRIFEAMFCGEHPEHRSTLLRYWGDINAYRLG